jgi:UDP-N-acetylglucosamine 2-epimerase (non-hydrolysing)
MPVRNSHQKNKELMKLLHVVGARPNFPKLAPVYKCGRARGLEQIVVHTGQHYDDVLSDSFFRVLSLPQADHNLGVGSASHAVQTARIMERFEPLVVTHRPDWVVLYGDVNSTVAAALVSAKLGMKIAHVEAGLRSFDRGMPEEINRIVVDRLANLLLTPSSDASANLLAEGEPETEIAMVGNVMVDSLLATLPAARAEPTFHRLQVSHGAVVVVTLHRPSNVDQPDRLSAIMAALCEIAEEFPVIFPVHPRTRQRIVDAGMNYGNIRLIEPLGYLQMVGLLDGARAVVTDSGGIQEESTILGVPCFTLRENTERPITISEGTNRLVPDLRRLSEMVRAATRRIDAKRPSGWDGRAAERVIDVLGNKF